MRRSVLAGLAAALFAFAGVASSSSIERTSEERVEILQDESALFTFRLTNRHAETRHFWVEFTTTNSTDWEVAPSGYTEMTIGPGDSLDLDLTVAPDGDVDPGVTTTVTAKASSCAPVFPTDRCLSTGDEGSTSFFVRVVAARSTATAVPDDAGAVLRTEDGYVHRVTVAPPASVALAPGAATEVAVEVTYEVSGGRCDAERRAPFPGTMDVALVAVSAGLDVSSSPERLSMEAACGTQLRTVVLEVDAPADADIPGELRLDVVADYWGSDAVSGASDSFPLAIPVEAPAADAPASALAPAACVGECARPAVAAADPWWADDRMQAVVGIVGLAASAGAGAYAIVGVRRRRSALASFLRRADDTFAQHKRDPTPGLAKLAALRREVREAYERGRFDDAHFLELEKRVREYVVRLRVAEVERRLLGVPERFLNEARRLVADGEITLRDVEYLRSLLAGLRWPAAEVLLAEFALWAKEDSSAKQPTR